MKLKIKNQKPHLYRKLGRKWYWLATTTLTKELSKKGAKYLTKELKIPSRVAMVPPSGFGIISGHKWGVYSVKKIGISTEI